MKQFGRTSIRSSYLVSYIGLATLACIVSGLLFFALSVAELKTVTLEEQRARLNLVAEDLDNQLEIFREIGARVKTSIVYRPFYAQRNAFYEMDVIDDFAKYKGYSPLLSEAYCMLHYSQSVYSMTAKYTQDLFVRYVLKVPAQSGPAFLQTLLDAEECDIVEHPSHSGSFLLLMPLRISAAPSLGTDACLVFVLDGQALAERAESISGLPAGSVNIRFHGRYLSGAADAGGTLSAVSASGNFEVSTADGVGRHYSRLSLYKTYGAVMIAGFIAVFAALAVYLARRSYSPIQKMMEQFNIPAHSNELQSIEKTISALKENNRISQVTLANNLNQLTEQRRIIRRQILFSIMSGEYDCQ
ncbi:MAG TPA: hypothetical protein PKE04_10725, partial [Clostridia bacterium]|nr:hypothetical protein [Clostridia bacterium]